MLVVKANLGGQARSQEPNKFQFKKIKNSKEGYGGK